MLRRLLPLLLVLPIGCAPTAERPERVVDRRITDAPAPRGAARLQAAMLRAHNDARAAVGVAPLAWDARLAADAQRHADEMAQTGVFAHAAQPQGPGHEGENLWTGTRGAYTYDEMAAAWIAEERDFVNARTPDSSRTGRWQDVAHYTQMVWRGSTAVGCALSTGPRDEYLVCRYAPSGNVWGWRAL